MEKHGRWRIIARQRGNGSFGGVGWLDTTPVTHGVDHASNRARNAIGLPTTLERMRPAAASPIWLKIPATSAEVQGVGELTYLADDPPTVAPRQRAAVLLRRVTPQGAPSADLTVWIGDWADEWDAANVLGAAQVQRQTAQPG